MLWENSLVMVDSETNSLWSHLLGECMRGPLTGKKLEVIPSMMTTWGVWKSRNPDSTVAVMPRSADIYDRSIVDIGSGLLIGLHHGTESRSWVLAGLAGSAVKLDHFGDIPIAIFLDQESLTAAIFDRRVDDRVLSFEWDSGIVTDSETGSVWDLLTGKAVSGPLKGRQLKLMPGIISDSATWHVYHPLEDMSLQILDLQAR